MTPVFILGATGNIGSYIADKLLQGSFPEIRIVGLANSRGYFIDTQGIATLPDNYTPGTVDVAILQQACSGKHGVIIDATGGKDIMRDLHLRVLSETDFHIVTANKNPLSLYDLSTFSHLNTTKYHAETTVMAGAGIVHFAQSRIQSGDAVVSLQGMFSGTLGYIFSEFDKSDAPISSIITDAYQKGYTEPHPYDDLSGLDVARKLLILARTLGHEIDLDAIQLEPVIANELYDPDVDTFLARCQQIDGAFDVRRREAQASGKTLRYVAQLDGSGFSVGLRAVDVQSPLGQLGGTHNIAICTTEAFAEPYPHIIQSRGAGIEVTGLSLIAQTMQICKNHAPI